MFTPVDPARRSHIKHAYSTRYLPPGIVGGMTDEGVPQPFDVVVARVVSLGQHARIETVDSRKATLFVGDEIVVCLANRYAPSQFEAVVPETLGRCHLVAAGGVAALALSGHGNMKDATTIDVLGFATDIDGNKLNLSDFRIPSKVGRVPAAERPFTIVVTGTSMDSGKTTSAAGIVHGLARAGLSVGAAKVTGTAAGGDPWLLADAGASPVLDFTAVGMASTYLAGRDRIADSFVTLTAELEAAGVDVVVIEIADGLFLVDTYELLASEELRDRCDAVVFAAGDAAGARSGVEILRSLELPVVAVAGLLTASPLAIRETSGCVDLPVLDLKRLRAADHNLLVGSRCAGRLERADMPVLADRAPSASSAEAPAALAS